MGRDKPSQNQKKPVEPAKDQKTAPPAKKDEAKPLVEDKKPKKK